MRFAVLFDLDGTLIDSTDFHVRTFLEAARRLGLPANEDVAARIRKLVGKRAKEIIGAVYPQLDESGVDALVREKWNISTQFLDEIKPIEKTIRVVQRVPCPKALVTSSTRVFVELVLRRIGLERAFDVIVTGEDTERGKPDPEPLLLAMKRLNAERGVYVGDTEYDRLAAEAAGLMFVHVSRVEEVERLCTSYATER